ncbi:MAG: type 1 glutamine amidotransferase [Acidobacteriota bacterium]|nr:type 1 glutamine amidotransferase [Acidobacteriota bacterium]
MRVLTIVHEDDAGPGVFGPVLAGAAVELDTWVPARRSQPPGAADAYDAILSFGGSIHPHQQQLHPWLVTEKRFLATALAGEVPLLGVCLGAELIAAVAGGAVTHMAHPEIGWYEVVLTDAGRDDPLLGPVGERFEALEWHSYAVALSPSADATELPSGVTALARSSNCLQAYRIGAGAWGIQFHAEVTDADFQHWLDTYTVDEDAVREGIDPEVLARASAPRMPAWHELGSGLCARFLETAASLR